MSQWTGNLTVLRERLEKVLGKKIAKLHEGLGELTLVVRAENYIEVATTLRDDKSLGFEQLIDLCGVDYSDYENATWEGPRFAVVSHLLSVSHNWRVRVRSFAPDDDMPVLKSVTVLWSAADWYEREAAEMLGIVFDGHPDPRPLLLRTRVGAAPLLRSTVLAARLAVPWPGSADGDDAGRGSRRRPQPPGVPDGWLQEEGA